MRLALRHGQTVQTNSTVLSVCFNYFLLRSYTGLNDRKTNLFRSKPPDNQTNISSISLAWLITLRGAKLTLHMKGKDIPLQAWTGPEGSRSLRLPDFKTIGTRWW